MHLESEPAIKRNYTVLSGLATEIYTVEPDNKFTDNCKYPLTTIQAASN